MPGADKKQEVSQVVLFAEKGREEGQKSQSRAGYRRCQRRFVEHISEEIHSLDLESQAPEKVQ